MWKSLFRWSARAGSSSCCSSGCGEKQGQGFRASVGLLGFQYSCVEFTLDGESRVVVAISILAFKYLSALSSGVSTH